MPNSLQRSKWLGETRQNGKSLTRQTIFGSVLSASLCENLEVPESLLTFESSLNYWLFDAPERETEPYPDDLDDTALVFGLRTRQKLTTPAQQALFTRLLIAGEKYPGGPYNTWCTTDPAWEDIDPVVNANIAWALAQCDIELPGLTAYVEYAWLHNLRSPYYPNVWVTRALLLRALPHPEKQIKHLRTLLKNDPPLTSLSKAAAVFCCKACGLATSLELPESIPWEPLITERAGKNPAYSSSEFAMQCWLQAAREKQSPRKVQPIKTSPAYRHFDEQSSPLWEPFNPILQKLKKADKTGEFMGIARHFAHTANLRIPGPTLDILEEATIWGWLAYTLADALLDNDAPSSLLPSVQWATRKSYASFINAGGISFIKIADRLFQKVDEANAWEQTYARKPGGELAFPRLSDRSIAHILGPLAVLHLEGLPLHHAEAIEEMGAIYLSLRQLLDDSHDWLEDHEQGIRTPIGEALRKAAKSSNVPDLRRAYAAEGVSYTLQEGNAYLHCWEELRKTIPTQYSAFLQKEQQSLAASLQTFKDAVEFTRALTDQAPQGETAHAPQDQPLQKHQQQSLRD